MTVIGLGRVGGQLSNELPIMIFASNINKNMG